MNLASSIEQHSTIPNEVLMLSEFVDKPQWTTPVKSEDHSGSEKGHDDEQIDEYPGMDGISSLMNNDKKMFMRQPSFLDANIPSKLSKIPTPAVGTIPMLPSNSSFNQIPQIPLLNEQLSSIPQKEPSDSTDQLFPGPQLTPNISQRLSTHPESVPVDFPPNPPTLTPTPSQQPSPSLSPSFPALNSLNPLQQTPQPHPQSPRPLPLGQSVLSPSPNPSPFVSGSLPGLGPQGLQGVNNQSAPSPSLALSAGYSSTLIKSYRNRKRDNHNNNHYNQYSGRGKTDTLSDELVKGPRNFKLIDHRGIRNMKVGTRHQSVKFRAILHHNQPYYEGKDNGGYLDFDWESNYKQSRASKPSDYNFQEFKKKVGVAPQNRSNHLSNQVPSSKDPQRMASNTFSENTSGNAFTDNNGLFSKIQTINNGYGEELEEFLKNNKIEVTNSKRYEQIVNDVWAKKPRKTHFVPDSKLQSIKNIIRQPDDFMTKVTFKQGAKHMKKYEYQAELSNPFSPRFLSPREQHTAVTNGSSSLPMISSQRTQSKSKPMLEERLSKASHQLSQFSPRTTRPNFSSELPAVVQLSSTGRNRILTTKRTSEKIRSEQDEAFDRVFDTTKSLNSRNLQRQLGHLFISNTNFNDFYAKLDHRLETYLKELTFLESYKQSLSDPLADLSKLEAQIVPRPKINTPDLAKLNENKTKNLQERVNDLSGWIKEMKELKSRALKYTRRVGQIETDQKGMT